MSDKYTNIEEKTDKLLVKLADSKWSSLWVLLFFLGSYGLGYFHLNIFFFILELFWWL